MFDGRGGPPATSLIHNMRLVLCKRCKYKQVLMPVEMVEHTCTVAHSFMLTILSWLERHTWPTLPMGWGSSVEVGILQDLCNLQYMPYLSLQRS